MATICLLSVKTIKSAYPHPERLHILRKWQKNWETERERETVTRMNIFILFRFKRYWDAVIVCRISETISTYTNPLPLRRILLETQLSLPLRRSHLRGPISAIRIICVVGFSSHSDRNPINVCGLGVMLLMIFATSLSTKYAKSISSRGVRLGVFCGLVSEARTLDLRLDTFMAASCFNLYKRSQ